MSLKVETPLEEKSHRALSIRTDATPINNYIHMLLRTLDGYQVSPLAALLVLLSLPIFRLEDVRHRLSGNCAS